MPESTVWQLDHDGRGVTLHATSEHAKAHAERNEPDGDTYWRWDETSRLKRHGETIATLRPVEVLGSEPSREPADIDADDVIDVLAAFINYVQSTDRHPTKDTHGDEATIDALEHAIECVRRYGRTDV